MIYDRFENAEQYRAIHPLFFEACDFLSAFDPATPDGQIKLRGDDLFVNVERYATEPVGDRKYESHQQYLDVQTVFTGTEMIYIEPLSGLAETEPFDAARDVAFYTGPDRNPLTLIPGEFAVFFPQDGHKPCCQVNGASDVLKVVAKIRIEATA